ncbi:Fc.00g107800.m01.CDS01 [Cosmosporella sp. VM-42]
MANSPASATNSPWTLISPHENDTLALRSIRAPAWVDSPHIRSTNDILKSSMLTLVACIYTALHLNVPSKTSWYHILLLKVKWVLTALLAPEIVLYIAINQLQQAWRLRRDLRKLQAESETVDKNFDFNLKCAFFIVMGAVHIDIDKILSIPDLDLQRAARFKSMSVPHSIYISPQGVIRLSKRGH